MDIAKIRKKLKQGGTRKAKKGGDESKEPTKRESGHLQNAGGKDIHEPPEDWATAEEVPFDDTLYDDDAEEDVPRVELLSFRVSGQEYALRIDEVQEILKDQPVTEVPGSKPFVCGILSLRGTIIPVIDIRQLLFVDESPSGVKRNRILVVHGPKGPIGIFLDGPLNVIAVPEEDFDETPESLSEEEARCLDGVARWEKKFIFMIKTAELFNFRSTLEA